MASVVGLIAGGGKLPLVVAQEVRGRGYQIVAVALEGEASKDLERYVDKIHWVRLGQLGQLIQALKGDGVSQAIMIGKVPMTHIFSNIKPDLRGALFYMRLKDRRGDTILDGLAQELQGEGINLLDSTFFIRPLLVEKGVMTKRSLDPREWEDVAFGWKVAKALASLSIGQTVVVKDLVVLAVEAIEGTDATIRRGGELGREGVVVVKVSRPDHDMRFDVPVVGLETLDSLKEARARVLALEAGRTLLMDREEVVQKADRSGIAIVAQ